jgi:hypothetical protein
MPRGQALTTSCILENRELKKELKDYYKIERAYEKEIAKLHKELKGYYKMEKAYEAQYKKLKLLSQREKKLLSKL